jgi:hypothetical protein
MALRRPLLALLIALVVVALPTGARASCAGPAVEVDAAAPVVTVTGQCG